MRCCWSGPRHRALRALCETGSACSQVADRMPCGTGCMSGRYGSFCPSLHPVRKCCRRSSLRPTQLAAHPVPYRAGTRVLPMAVIGAVLQQPPLAVLAQQALMICELAGTGYACTQTSAAGASPMWSCCAVCMLGARLTSVTSSLAADPTCALAPTITADITSDAAYCDSQLASDPLSRARLAALWNALEDWVPQVCRELTHWDAAASSCAIHYW